jgi:hypothetical protein
MKPDTFTIGQCKICRETTAIKNGYCPKCAPPDIEIPDFIKDIFNSGFGN